MATVGIPAAIVLLHLATWRQYGIFRDELYYLACARHLDWGYVDHPPLSIAVLAAVRAAFGESLFAMRAVVAVCAGAAAWLTADTARALGGGGFAQRLASLAAALSPGVIALCGFYSMNAFDVVFWIACLRVLAAILSGADPRAWLLFGVLAGLGLENKISVLFLGFGVAVGLVAARRFDLLRGRWAWIGGAVALGIFVPHLLWQASHGAPTLEFMRNARERKLATNTPLSFLSEVASNAGPGAFPIWIGGVGFLLFASAARAWRVLGWAWLTVLAYLLVAGGKPYYAIASTPLVFAAGGVAWERWARGRWARAGIVALLVAGAAIAAPLAKGFLPEGTLIAYMKAIGIKPSSGERQSLGALPQHFADMHGWEDLAVAVAGVYRSLPDAERSHVCIAGQNYGEAGAIDHFGPALGLPRAVSTHNNYWLWGVDGCDNATWIVIGDRKESLEALFESVERADTFRCDLCMPYENDNPIWVARGLKGRPADLWPRMKNFI